MEGKATDSINGRFAKDDRRSGVSGNGEAAQVLLRTGRQAVPRLRRGAAKFGANGSVLLVSQEEDGVGPGVGVEGARLDQRRQQHGGQAALSDQVISDAGHLAGVWQWEPQR